ncbi:MAG: histidine phosphatase family protein [Thermoplasmatota archaeon]
MATQVWFIRHGEVEAPYVGTFVGSTDVGLSHLGHHQAAAIGAYLKEAPIEAVISSPRKRARQTAAPLAKELGLELDIVEGLAEMHFGQWEALAWPDIEARDPEFAAKWQADPSDLSCPGGESANGFAGRVHDALGDVLARYDGKTIAVFAHAGTNRALLSAATGMPYMDTFAFAQDYGCVNAAAWDGDMAQIALLNLVPGPRSEANGDGGRSVEE